MNRRRTAPIPIAILLAIAFLTILFALPAAAQCTEPDCGNDGVGPGISVSPDGETYILDGGAALDVAYVIGISDRDVVDRNSIAIAFNGTPVSNWTTESLLDGTFVRVRGTVTLRVAGNNVLTVQARDRYGSVGSGSETFRVEFTDPELPIVYRDTYHNEFRDTNQSQLGLVYTTPSYVSMGAEHAVTLRYSAELASPNAYVSFDAKPDPRTAANVVGMSLRVTDDSTGALVGREFYWAKLPSGGKQRMGVFWSMRTRATGVYLYTAAIRSHFANGTVRERLVPVRVMILNESASRYGAGWNVAGVQRLYGVVNGIILHEGNGILRFYEKNPCTPTLCTFRRPEGDFSVLVFDRTNSTWTRTYKDGSTVTFDDRGLMTRVTSPTGASTQFTWGYPDAAPTTPVLTHITDAAQKVTALTYSPAGYLQRITDPAGREVLVTVNASGDLTAIAGAGAPLQVTYGTTHLATSFTGEHGTWSAGYYRGTLSGVTSPEALADGRVQRLVTKFLRAEWKATLLSTEGTGLANLAPAVDAESVVEEIVDPRGHKTLTTRNRFGQPLAVTDLAGDLTGYAWTADGLLKTLVEPNGRTTEYDWNTNGQLIAVRVDGDPTYQASYTRPDYPDHEVVGGVTRWYTRGTRGELLRSWYGAQTDATRKGTTYEYDALFRLTRTTGPKGERREWTYGDWGNPATARVILEDGSASTTTYTYDNAGRIFTSTNSLGQRTTFGYDSRNRVREVLDPLQRVLKLDYTGQHLTQVTDRAGKVFGFAYNALGWLTTETFPGSQSRTYAYDADGLLLTKTDRRGLSVSSTYDAAHRQRTRTADNATASYAYPDRYTFTASNAEGSLTRVLHPTLGIADSVRMTLGGVAGRVYELKNVLDPEQNHSIGTDLNFYANGVLFQTNPTRTAATPDGDGGRVTITDPRGLATTLLHDVAGNHIQTILPNNVTQSHSFATDGRLLATWFSGGSVNDILGSDFTYDALGRLQTRTNNLGKMKWTYGYTTAGELGSFVQTAAMPPVGCDPRIRICSPTWSTVRSAAYTYDNAGNRTDNAASLAPNSNRHTSFAGYALEYDFEGNLIRKSKAGFDQRLTWNALGQLTSITTNGNVVTFGYDAMNRRVRRTADGYSRYFLYDEDDLLLELGPDGAVWRSYTHLPGTDRPLSVREFGTGTESVYYYVIEQPGHVRALLDANGSIIGEYAYTPFGEPIATAKGEGIAQPFRFMARELDPGTRLYYVRNRWYDPELGRFISEDPLGLAGGINTYAYLGSDPMNGRDPSGLMQEDGTICDIMPWLNMCQGPAILLPTLYVGSGAALGGRLSQYGPPETGDEYDFRTSYYKTCADNTFGRGFNMTLYNSAECREIRDRDTANAAAETARREECYRQANAGSTWGQDFRHEAKWNAAWGIAGSLGGAAVGAIAGTMICGPGCGVVGGKYGAALGAGFGVFGTAAVEATVDRAGDRYKRCGSAW